MAAWWITEAIPIAATALLPVVLITFILLALLWLFRKNINIGEFVLPGWTSVLPVSGFIDDGTIAIFVALLLFIIPSRQIKGGRIMDWKTAVKLPWGIVILFGGLDGRTINRFWPFFANIDNRWNLPDDDLPDRADLQYCHN